MADLAQCVWDARALLGESPVWCPAEQVLYWVDIRKPAFHRYEPSTGATRTWPLREEIGSLALRKQGGALVALQSGLAFLDLHTGVLVRACEPEPNRPGNRFNDGRCDRRGRFWVGSMPRRERTPTGALYRVDPDRRWHRMVEWITVPNSLAWSPDDRTMYFADSPTGTIWAYEFHADEGTLGHRRVFATVPPGEGYPDGSTVDADGCLWNAQWDGSRLTRYTPAGRVDRVVDLPVRRPTSCAFGGPRLDVLYVTSASKRSRGANPAPAGLDGGLFALEVGVRGLPEPRFAG